MEHERQRGAGSGSWRTLARALVATAALGGLLSVSVVSEASFPGRNGDIVVYSLRATSGSALLFVSSNGVVRRTLGAFTGPRFRGSPDGRRLVFEEGQGIRVSDLSGDHRVGVVRVGGEPAWSPDGQRLTFIREGAVWIVALNGRRARRVTAGSGDSAPIWSPDGRTIAFVRRRPSGQGCTTRSDIYSVSPATGAVRLLYRPRLSCGAVGPPDWSPDSRNLVVNVEERPAPREPSDPRAKDFVGITILRTDGARVRRLTAPVLNASPVWSPDGRRIAYTDSSPRCKAVCEIGLHIVATDGRANRTISYFRDDSYGVAAPAWLVRRTP